jgi:hypothetical protein
MVSRRSSRSVGRLPSPDPPSEDSQIPPPEVNASRKTTKRGKAGNRSGCVSKGKGKAIAGTAGAIRTVMRANHSSLPPASPALVEEELHETLTSTLFPGSTARNATAPFSSRPLPNTYTHFTPAHTIRLESLPNSGILYLPDPL